MMGLAITLKWLAMLIEKFHPSQLLYVSAVALLYSFSWQWYQWKSGALPSVLAVNRCALLGAR